MKAFSELLWVNLRLFYREPVVFFFALIFPLLLLLLFGLMFGNDGASQHALIDGYGYVDAEVPGLAVLVIGTVAFQQIPAFTALRRELGILRTLRAMPMRPLTYMLADVVANTLIVVVAALVLAGMGWLLFDMRYAGSVPGTLLGLIFCSLALFSSGYMLASILPSARLAQAIGNLLFFPMLFLSGATIPLQVMPEHLREFSGYLPLRQAVDLVQGLWLGLDPAAMTGECIALSCLMVVAIGLTVRYFRWS